MNNVYTKIRRKINMRKSLLLSIGGSILLLLLTILFFYVTHPKIPTIDLTKHLPVTRGIYIKHFGVGYAVKGYAPPCKKMGADLVRIPLVAWGKIEPELPKNGTHHYNWQHLDEIIQEYQNSGFRVQLIVKCANPWACKSFASGSEKYRLSSPPKDQYWSYYYDFIYNLVERYDGDGYKDMPQLKFPVLDYEIESEAHNTEFFWNGSVDEYKRLLETAYHAAKKANPKARIILSGINFGDYGEIIDQSFSKGNVTLDVINMTIQKYPPNIRSKANFIIESLKDGDHYDAIDLHFNRDYSQIPGEVKLINLILMTYSIHNKSIIAGDVCSCPWHTILPNSDIGRKHFRIEQASLSTKKLITSVVWGVETFVLEGIRDFPVTYKHASKESFRFAGIFDDEKTPRPVFYAYKQAIEKISGAKRVDCWEINGVYVYKFYFPKKPTLYVIWCEGKSKRVKLPISSHRVKIETLAINNHTECKIVDVIDHTITIEITDKPIFIEEV